MHVRFLGCIYGIDYEGYHHPKRYHHFPYDTVRVGGLGASITPEVARSSCCGDQAGNLFADIDVGDILGTLRFQ